MSVTKQGAFGRLHTKNSRQPTKQGVFGHIRMRLFYPAAAILGRILFVSSNWFHKVYSKDHQKVCGIGMDDIRKTCSIDKHNTI